MPEPIKYYLVSPKEPSGMTWLANCLLELGIKTYRSVYGGGDSWIQDGSQWRLRPEESQLYRYLPILSRQSRFTFRDDIEVEWTHDWPLRAIHENVRVIFFTRDPRDAIYSGYKRQSDWIEYRDFVDHLDCDSLINKIDNWYLFHLLWLDLPGIRVYRFEDYKQDAGALLRRILEENNLPADADAIDRAVASSDYSQAAQAESQFLKTVQAVDRPVMRTGSAGAWTQRTDEGDIVACIEARSAGLMQRLGYSTQYDGATPPPDLWPHLGLIPKFTKHIRLCPGLRHDQAGNPFENEFVLNAIRFLKELDLGWLIRSQTPIHQVPTMFETYGYFLRNLLSRPEAKTEDCDALLTKLSEWAMA